MSEDRWISCGTKRSLERERGRDGGTYVEMDGERKRMKEVREGG